MEEGFVKPAVYPHRDMYIFQGPICVRPVFQSYNHVLTREHAGDRYPIGIPEFKGEKA
jgi:hypothetical protein